MSSEFRKEQGTSNTRIGTVKLCHNEIYGTISLFAITVKIHVVGKVVIWKKSKNIRY